MQLTTKFIQIIKSLFDKSSTESPIKKATKIKKEIKMESQSIPTETKWNFSKIKIAVNNLALEIHNLKKEIRQPNTNISSEQYWALTNLKGTATLLCTIRAARRHKIHLKGFTFEEQEKWLQEELTNGIREIYSKKI